MDVMKTDTELLRLVNSMLASPKSNNPEFIPTLSKIGGMIEEYRRNGISSVVLIYAEKFVEKLASSEASSMSCATLEISEQKASIGVTAEIAPVPSVEQNTNNMNEVVAPAVSEQPQTNVKRRHLTKRLLQKKTRMEFHCLECGAIYWQEKAFEKHLCVPRYCKLCGKSMAGQSKAEREEHLKNVHRLSASGCSRHVTGFRGFQGTFPCDRCNYLFFSKSSRNEHYLTCVRMPCLLCGRSFTWSWFRDMHAIQEHGFIPPPGKRCRRCDRHFQKGGAFIDHIQACIGPIDRQDMGGVPHWECPWCLLSFADEKDCAHHAYWLHIFSDDMTCPFCHVTQSSEQALQRHIATCRDNVAIEVEVQSGEREEQEMINVE